MFDDLLGQPQAKAQLAAELAAGKLAHAYLFVGPGGVGRATAARGLFMALNCQGGEQSAAGLFGGQTAPAKPCGQCGPCRRALAWQHEELFVLAPPEDAASAQIKVEAVREVIRALGFPPLAGATRMVLIRQAQHMNPTAANALLKTLEEPPPRNIIVLCAPDARELLPTLVSRCRRVTFTPLDEGLIAGELARRGVDDTSARLRAAMAGGSLGRALRQDETALAQRLEGLRAVLAGSGQALDDWAFADNLVGSFRGPERIDRQGLAEALDSLCLHFRDMAVAAVGRPELTLLPGPAPAGLSAVAAGQAFARIRRAQAEIMANASPELAVTVLLQDLRTLASGAAID